MTRISLFASPVACFPGKVHRSEIDSYDSAAGLLSNNQNLSANELGRVDRLRRKSLAEFALRRGRLGQHERRILIEG